MPSTTAIVEFGLLTITFFVISVLCEKYRKSILEMSNILTEHAHFFAILLLSIILYLKWGSILFEARCPFSYYLDHNLFWFLSVPNLFLMLIRLLYVLGPGINSEPYHVPKFRSLFLSPVYEEVIFRWLLMTGLIHVFQTIAPGYYVVAFKITYLDDFHMTFGTALAVLISNTLFVFCHGTPSALKFMTGFLLSYVYMSTSTILAPIILHSVANVPGVANDLLENRVIRKMRTSGPY